MISFGSEAKQDWREPARAPGAQPASAGVTPSAPQAASPASLKPAPAKAAVLGPTLRFKGELSAEEDFILQGSLEGSITNPQCVTVGTDGSVIGDIHARIVTIDGRVEGDLYGVEAVVVHQTARVTGNIYAPRIGIVEGAFFSGRVEMTAKAAAQATKSAPASQTLAGVMMSPEETERVLAQK
jgi:cytoskeletal protein CcmA (bactofilin family)